MKKLVHQRVFQPRFSALAIQKGPSLEPTNPVEAWQHILMEQQWRKEREQDWLIEETDGQATREMNEMKTF